MSQKIIVVGLGFGDENSLSLGVKTLLESGRTVWLRTEKHPVVPWLQAQNIQYQSFDFIYEKGNSFEWVYDEIGQHLLQSVTKDEEIIYAVPGHPTVAEKTVQILRDLTAMQEVELDIRGGSSFIDIAMARLEIDPIEGMSVLDGTDLQVGRIHPQMHLVIAQVYDRWVASEVKLSLMEVYPDEYHVQIVSALGIPSMERIIEVPLYALDREDLFSDLTSVYVPPIQTEELLHQRFDYLQDLIQLLRSPQGCPWDRKQTHQSLRPYLIEEAYEFIEAVNKEDSSSMKEELGDVLLQIVLHVQIAKEEGTFMMEDVIKTLVTKMIRRHPHVFAKESVTSAAQVESNWEEIKKQERKGDSPTSILDSIPTTMPLLLKAYEAQKKAARVGFDWDQIEGVWEKVQEELQELKEASDEQEREKEFGDILFALLSVARFQKINPELALERTYHKFQNRFRYIEKKAAKSGSSLTSYRMEQLDQWWEEAKQEDR